MALVAGGGSCTGGGTDGVVVGSDGGAGGGRRVARAAAAGECEERQHGKMHAVIDDALAWVQTWESRWGERPAAPAVDPDRWAAAWDEFTTRMDGNFPFFHPRFAGQMLKPPHAGGGRRLRRGDARQPQQPRARRRRR